MTTIEIQKGVTIGIEELIKSVAQMDISSLEKFSDEINTLIARKKVPQPSVRELELIEIIYLPLDANIQARYDKLVAKNVSETISEEEHIELLNLIEIAEQHNVNWLAALVELAQLRAVSLEEVKKQLGIKQPNSLT